MENVKYDKSGSKNINITWAGINQNQLYFG